MSGWRQPIHRSARGAQARSESLVLTSLLASYQGWHRILRNSPFVEGGFAGRASAGFRLTTLSTLASQRKALLHAYRGL